MNDNFELPKLNEDKKENKSEVIREIKHSWKDMFKYVTTCKGKELFYLVLRIALIIILIVLFKLPFDLLRDLIINLFPVMGITIGDRLLNGWYALCNILYSIFGIVFFYKIVRERYDNLIKK